MDASRRPRSPTSDGRGPGRVVDRPGRLVGDGGDRRTGPLESLALMATKAPMSVEGWRISSEVYQRTDPLLVTLLGPVLVSITRSHPRPYVSTAGGFDPYCGVGVPVHIIA